MNKYILTRWSVPFAGFLLAFMGGISYAWGVFIIPMTTTFDWTHAEATMPFTMFMVVFAITMVPAGMLQDKIGPRKVSLAGAVLLFIAYSLASLVVVFPYAWWLVLTYGLIGGVACGLIYACVAPPARKWFPDKPGLAISFAVMGFGLAAVIVAPLKANYLIPNYGIGGTLLILAIITSLVCIFAAWLIRNPEKNWKPLGWIPKASKDTKDQVSRHTLKPSSIIKSPLFIQIWLMFVLVAAGGLVAIGTIPAYGETILGLTPIEAAVAISIFAGLNGFGRPIAGFLSDKFGIMSVMIITYTIQAFAFLSIPFFATTELTLYIVAALLGWGYAVTLALFPTLTSRCFGVKNMGVNYGLVFTAFGVGAISPLVGSWVFDSTGSFASIFIFAGILTGLGLILSIVISKKYSFL